MTIPSVRRGTAMIAASLLVVVMASAATVLLTTSIGRLNEQTNRADEVLLSVTAESVFNAGFDQLRTTIANRGLILPTGRSILWTDDALGVAGLNRAQVDNAAGGRVFTLTALDSGATPTVGDEANESYQLVARSWRNDRNVSKADSFAGRTQARTVEAVVSTATRAATVPRVAMFALDSYSFMGSADSDSFDSDMAVDLNNRRSDVYDQWEAFSQTDTSDHGDLSSGGTLTVAKPENVKGATASNVAMPIEMPETDAPAGTTWTPGTNQGLTANTTLAAGTYRTKFVNLSGKTLTITGGTTCKLYVEGPFVLSSSQIVFADYNTRIEIYQKDFSGDAGTGVGPLGTKLNGNAEIGLTQTAYGLKPCKPTQLVIFSNYGMDSATDNGTEKQHDFEMRMNGNAGFSGLIIAPGAPFRMNGNFHFFGGILAKTFGDRVNGNYHFRYDDALSRLDWAPAPRVVVELKGIRTYRGDVELTGDWSGVLGTP